MSETAAAPPAGANLQSGQQIVVNAIPDLTGVGPYSPGCEGCDGAFETGDAIRGRDDPLPPMVFILRDGDGVEIRRDSSSQQSNGRQKVTFYVNDPGSYQVELLQVSSGWELCPAIETLQMVQESDFEPGSGIARLQFGFWHGCDVPTATPSGDQATAVPTVEPTGVPATVAAPTESPTATELPPEEPEPIDAEDDSEATAGAEGDAQVTAYEAVPQQASVLAPSSELEPRKAGSGALLGLVYIDENGDGELGPDEPGVPGVLVTVADGGWMQHKYTTGAGNYRFGRLAPASYRVSAELPGGYRFTTVDTYEDVLVEGEAVAGIDFGLEPAIESKPSVPTAMPIPALGLPRTGALPHSPGRVLLGLAAVISALGMLGLALESGLARRS